MIHNNGGANALFDTANVGAFNGDYTVECWLRPDVDVGPFMGFWAAGDATLTGTEECFLEGASGNGFWNNSTAGSTDTQWPGAAGIDRTKATFWALSHTVAAGQSTMYRGDNGGALASVTFADVQAVTMANMIILNFFSTAEGVNGDMGSWVLRNAALTQREIENDYQRLRPWSRMSSVQRFHPLLNVSGQLLDWSGNGFALTLFGGPFTEGVKFPPVPWSPPAVMMM